MKTKIYFRQRVESYSPASHVPSQVLQAAAVLQKAKTCPFAVR
jgi:hypothetical protein